MKKLSVVAGIFMACTVFMANKACETEPKVSSGTSAKESVNIACKTDADCALVNSDCCGCRQGGAQMAIASSAKKSWSSALDSRCGQTNCMQMISNHPSCGKEAKCIKGQCVLD